MNTSVDFVCQYCGRNTKNKGGLSQHEPFCAKNPNKISYIQRGGRIKGKKYASPKSSWIRGKTHKQLVDDGIWSAEKLEKIRCAMRENGKRSTGTALTKDAELRRRRKISESGKGKLGGYRKGSGRGKKGWYRGIFCDSSWELAYVIYCIETNQHIERCKEKRMYSFGGRTRTYFPDFIVDGKLIEIKGYITPQWIAKQSANPDIVVLGKNEMKPILDYVISKYGNNFISLYE